MDAVKKRVDLRVKEYVDVVREEVGEKMRAITNQQLISDTLSSSQFAPIY